MAKRLIPTSAGILLPEKTSQLNSGKVIAVGPGSRDKAGNLIPPSVKEGDHVLLPEYGGSQIKLDDKEPEAMAEEEPKALNYIPEVILKKRKNSEAWALRKKDQLQKKDFQLRKSKDYIKKPEDFILEYRNRELDLIRMKRRVKRKRGEKSTPCNKPILVIRIQGKQDMHPTTRKHLFSLGLRRIFSAVFVKPTDGVMAKLARVEPYVTYGYPNLKNIKELIYKKGHAKIEKRKVPLTDNNLIEQELGKFGIVCMEDIVHHIENVDPHFKEVVRFMWPFELNKPADGLKGLKNRFKDGGDSGDREDLINDLINKMN